MQFRVESIPHDKLVHDALNKVSAQVYDTVSFPF
jgi:hypothetical protein